MTTSFYLIYLICAIITSDSKRVFKVGVTMPYNHSDMETRVGFVSSAGAIGIALDRIASERLLPNNVSFNFIYRESDCTESQAVGFTTEFLMTDNVDVIIGPPCTASAMVTALMASYYNVPVISWAAKSQDLSDPERFKTFMRTTASSRTLSMAVYNLLKHYKWNEIALFYNDQKSIKDCKQFASNLIDVNVEDLDLSSTEPFELAVKVQRRFLGKIPSASTIDNFLQMVQTRARIVIICLNTQAAERHFLLRITELNMANNEYVYILPRYYIDDRYELPWLDFDSETIDSTELARARYAAQYSIVVKLITAPF